ncbi:MAG: hypothetical protein NC418_00130 [Muribaculaceae bacterium]|nr:hypothetical protein [Muribaculaceae bacterium]
MNSKVIGLFINNAPGHAAGVVGCDSAGERCRDVEAQSPAAATAEIGRMREATREGWCARALIFLPFDAQN